MPSPPASNLAFVCRCGGIFETLRISQRQAKLFEEVPYAGAGPGMKFTEPKHLNVRPLPGTLLELALQTGFTGTYLVEVPPILR